jgi:integrase
MRTNKSPLTAAKVKSLLSAGKPVKYPDGRSLYLRIRALDQGCWIGQYADHGKQQTKALGRVLLLRDAKLEGMTLADARSAWERFRADLRAGFIMTSPAAPRSARVVPTGTPYAEAVAEYCTGMSNEWRGGATGKYARLFAADAKVVMPGGRVLGTYTWPELTDDVIAAYVGNMSARNARDTTVRLRSIREFQKSGKLPKRAKKVEHHASVPWKDTPAFYALLNTKDECARALAFVILTGVRIGDVLGTGEKAPATWAEIDGDTWVIPGERTKIGDPEFPHAVPLTAQMLALIGDRKEPIAPLFGVGYFQVHRYLKKLRPKDADIHGFRASFRSWMQDQGFNREVAELCLHHKIGDKSEQAYKRGESRDLRRAIMERWSALLTAPIERPAKAA